jgi:hypothetical protein
LIPLKSVKPADGATSNRLRKRAHLGNPRWLPANTSRLSIQARRTRLTSFTALGVAAAVVLRRLAEARR